MEVVTYRDELPILSSDFRWFWSSSPHPIGSEVFSQDLEASSLIGSNHFAVRIAPAAYERAMDSLLPINHL